MESGSIHVTTSPCPEDDVSISSISASHPSTNFQSKSELTLPTSPCRMWGIHARHREGGHRGVSASGRAGVGLSGGGAEKKAMALLYDLTIQDEDEDKNWSNVVIAVVPASPPWLEPKRCIPCDAVYQRAYMR